MRVMTWRALSTSRYGEEADAKVSDTDKICKQLFLDVSEYGGGGTLVHFSPQPEPFLPLTD